MKLNMKLIVLLSVIVVTISCSKSDDVTVPVSNASVSNTWHYCGHPTADGTPCQRHVSGTTGYCWQHK